MKIPILVFTIHILLVLISHRTYATLVSSIPCAKNTTDMVRLIEPTAGTTLLKKGTCGYGKTSCHFNGVDQFL